MDSAKVKKNYSMNFGWANSLYWGGGWGGAGKSH